MRWRREALVVQDGDRLADLRLWKRLGVMTYPLGEVYLAARHEGNEVLVRWTTDVRMSRNEFEGQAEKLMSVLNSGGENDECIGLRLGQIDKEFGEGTMRVLVQRLNAAEVDK